MTCPICDSVLTMPIWLLRGSRTKRYGLVRLCLRCTFIFQRPNYSEDDEVLKGDFQWHLGKFDSHKAHSDRIVSGFKRLHPNARTLLDIGCGIGASLIQAKLAGLHAKGVEPNPHAARYAKVELGLDCIEGFFGPDAMSEKFDLIILDMVLEHVPRPREMIAATVRTLTPGGVIYLAVPTRTKPLARIPFSLLFNRNRRSMFWDNDVHINHFSRANILKMVSSYGARIEEDVSGGAYYIRGPR